MCYFITATLPKGTDLARYREFFDKYDMAFTPINNRSVKSQLRPEEIYCRATKSYCDCATVLGSLNQFKQYQKLLKSQKVRNLKKKKWTQEQIDNWIQEKLKTKKLHLKSTLTTKERELETEKWFNFLRDIIQTKLINRVGILKHWYNGDLESEEIKIIRTEKINFNDKDKNFLLNIEANVLYEFLIPNK